MLKNVKDWKTTIPTVIGILLALLGTLKPDLFTPEAVADLNDAALNLVNGAGLLILTVTGMVSSSKTAD